MPFYEYHCDNCANEELIFLLMSDKHEERKCDKCKGGIMNRVFSELPPDINLGSTPQQRVKTFLDEAKRELKDDQATLKKREKK